MNVSEIDVVSEVLVSIDVRFVLLDSIVYEFYKLSVSGV